MSEHDHRDEATDFLYDIAVANFREQAVSGRKMFMIFQPFYAARDRQLSLEENLIEAFRSAGSAAQEAIRGMLREALDRCSSQWLGWSRTLTVLQVQQSVIPEMFSSTLASRLLRLEGTDTGETALWLTELLRFWEGQRISPDIPVNQWLEVIAKIDCREITAAIGYVAGMPLKNNVELHQVFDLAHERLAHLSPARDAITASEILATTQALSELEELYLPIELRRDRNSERLGGAAAPVRAHRLRMEDLTLFVGGRTDDDVGDWTAPVTSEVAVEFAKAA